MTVSTFVNVLAVEVAVSFELLSMTDYGLIIWIYVNASIFSVSLPDSSNYQHYIKIMG